MIVAWLPTGRSSTIRRPPSVDASGLPGHREGNPFGQLAAGRQHGRLAPDQTGDVNGLRVDDGPAVELDDRQVRHGGRCLGHDVDEERHRTGPYGDRLLRVHRFETGRHDLSDGHLRTGGKIGDGQEAANRLADVDSVDGEGHPIRQLAAEAGQVGLTRNDGLRQLFVVGKVGRADPGRAVEFDDRQIGGGAGGDFLIDEEERQRLVAHGCGLHPPGKRHVPGRHVLPHDDTRAGREVFDEELTVNGWRIVEETLPTDPDVEEDALGRDATQPEQSRLTQNLQLRRSDVGNDAGRAVERGNGEISRVLGGPDRDERGRALLRQRRCAGDRWQRKRRQDEQDDEQAGQGHGLPHVALSPRLTAVHAFPAPAVRRATQCTTVSGRRRRSVAAHGRKARAMRAMPTAHRRSGWCRR